MKHLAILAALSLTFLCGMLTPARAQDQKEIEFKITPALQAELDSWKQTAIEWVADPTLVAAVQEANAAGPIEDMDKKAWTKLPENSRVVASLTMNPVAKALIAKMKETKGAVSEVFLNGDKGHKVAFAQKTSSYIHAGKSKFDVPFTTLKPWQGKPEADKSTFTHQIQISVPVLEPKNADGTAQKPVGVLVLGINLSYLKEKVGEQK